MAEHFDVLIVGAGLSGIGAAYHLQTEAADRSYMILEGRDSIGGTWDLFRYPGIRSDSDMYTLGYRFRPWTDPKAIADGPSILRYVKDTAAEAGIAITSLHWLLVAPAGLSITTDEAATRARTLDVIAGPVSAFTVYPSPRSAAA